MIVHSKSPVLVAWIVFISMTWFLSFHVYAENELYTLVSEPHPDDPLKAWIYRLSNGLEIYLSVNRQTPRFFAEIAVRAGSKHDPPEATGLAHYMEHLLFKGSQRLGTIDYEQEASHLKRIEELYEAHFQETDSDRIKAIYQQITQESTQAAAFAIPNEFDQVYRAIGGKELNAHTWHEEVVYKINLPMNCLEKWAMLESDRFLHPVFRLFQTELETVYEEMNRAKDNKDRAIYEAVNAQLFKVHPYGQQPTLGLMEHLKKPSITRLNQFYQQYYAANNMAIFISGDIDVENTISIIAQYFSSWEKKEIPQTVPWNEPPLQGREEVRIQFPAEPFVMLAFRLPSQNHPDVEPLRMVDMMLDNAVAGLINLNLNQAQRVRQSGSYLLLMNDYSVQYLYGTPKEGQTLEEVERLLLEQVALIKGGQFEEWLLPAIINDYKKREKTALESDAKRVEMMRSAWIAFEPWDHAYRMIERMAQVTRDDVIRVANTYFGADYVAGFRETGPYDPPRVEKPPMPEINVEPGRRSSLAQLVLEKPVETIEPAFLSEGVNFQRTNHDGVTFFYAPNPINDVFSFSIVTDYGTRQDARMAIAGRLFQRTGTKRLTPSELQIAWYTLGTDLNVSVEDNQSTLALTGLDENFDESLALLAEMVTTPQTDEHTLEELKRIILIQREDAKKDPETIMGALTDYNRFGEKSPWLCMLNSTAVMNLSIEELQETMRNALKCRHYVLYSGSLPLEEVMRIYALHRVTKNTLQEPPPYIMPSIRVPDSPILYFFNREMTQAHIQLEFGDVPYDPKLSPAAQLFNMYFAGSMSGIVFQELREVRALAYLVGARYKVGERKYDVNTMVGVIQTQADKTVEAVMAFSDVLDNMPLSAERYEIAREALLNDYRTSRTNFRMIPKTLLEWEYRGLDPDPRKEWYQAIMNASSGDLLATFHQNHIKGKTKLISIVGDSSRIPMDSLASLAHVQPINLSQIFVD